MSDNDKAEEKKPTSKEKMMALKETLMTREGKIGLGATVGLLLLTLLVMKACEPRKGSILYGVCSAFLETQLLYPELLEQNYVEQYSSGVRIYYTQVDGFGQYLNEFIECTYAQNEQEGLFLAAVIFNTIKPKTKKTTIANKGRLYRVEQKHIDHFNKSGVIQAVIASEPDLTLPRYKPFEFYITEDD
jgi:hypothetical protein